MTISSLPLSYCTNVHPGQSAAEVQQQLEDYTLPVRNGFGRPLAAGLWLARPVVTELQQDSSRLTGFADFLRAHELTCHTLNAFPYGDFHSPRVKENVYIPDWSHPDRFDYTWDCARVLAGLLPEGADGSISTVPLGFKGFDHPPDFTDRCIEQLIELARRLDHLRQEDGRCIRLALEPEPSCILETTDEAISFFRRLWDAAAAQNALDAVQTHLGVCYDVCHQAVEFEDVARSIQTLDRAGVRINKLHITCAIELDRPADNVEARQALARYAEPRYLHQTLARSPSGEILRALDLTEELALQPDRPFLEADRWRVHFHVPVNAESLGPLRTTRAELKHALSAVAALEHAPHLEVETYTWEVLPDGRRVGLVEGLTRELTATVDLLQRS